MVVRVCDVQVATGVDGNSGWRIELGCGRGSAVSAVAFDARSGYGADDAARRNFANNVIICVRNVEIAVGVIGDGGGVGEGSRGAGDGIGGAPRSDGQDSLRLQGSGDGKE